MMAHLIDELESGVLRTPAVLRAQIEAAFAGRVPPDGERILPDRDHCSECRAVYKILRGRSWQHVDVESIRYERAGLLLLAPASLAYYLPAFLMVAAADDPAKADPGEQLEYMFSRRCREQHRDLFDARLAALPAAGLDAVAATLRFIGERRVAAGGDDRELRDTLALLDAEARARAAGDADPPPTQM